MKLMKIHLPGPVEVSFSLILSGQFALAFARQLDDGHEKRIRSPEVPRIQLIPVRNRAIGTAVFDDLLINPTPEITAGHEILMSLKRDGMPVPAESSRRGVIAFPIDITFPAP